MLSISPNTNTLYGLDLVLEKAQEMAENGTAWAEWIPRVFMLNPFASLITGYRDALFYGQFLAPAYWAVLVVESVVLLFVGYHVYHYFDRRVIKFL